MRTDAAMDFLLFTYPNCHKCEDMKAFFRERQLAKEEYDVTGQAGRLKIRQYIRDVKRDDKGSIILPTLVCLEGGGVAAVLNTREEFESWLQSRA
jgi:glutaredoxin